MIFITNSIRISIQFLKILKKIQEKYIECLSYCDIENIFI